MKNKIRFVALATLVLFGLTACGGRDQKETENKNNRVQSTTSSIKVDDKEQNKKNEEKNTVSYDEINQGKEPEAIYEKFVKSVKNDAEVKAQSLVIVLYKPECSDCKKVENYIAFNVVDSEKVASSISYVENFNYNAVAVDITKEVPDWVQNIYGIGDENNQYHTPTVVVTTLKKSSDGNFYWEIFDRSVGTNKDAIVHALDFYIRNDYKSSLEVAPTEDPRFLLK